MNANLRAELALDPDPLDRLTDGTIKQRNPLTGTQVWTVPGRAKRPSSHRDDVHEIPGRDLKPEDFTDTCAFCTNRYSDTPPEKSRLVKGMDGHFHKIEGLPAKSMHDMVAEFRRIPNLYEIVSYDYWHLNHNHYPSEEQNRRMAAYLATPEGYDHVLHVVKMRLQASGEGDPNDLPDEKLVQYATGLFAGGHDVIVAKRHYIDGATKDTQNASAGTLSVAEHRAYTGYTIAAMEDLYGLNPAVKYVTAFQNWLKPAGASFDHLHKQLVAVDEYGVQIEQESQRVAANPLIYDQILHYAAHRQMAVLGNEHAIGFADFGHRYPTLAVWALGPALLPWEYSREQVDGISDVLHALHCALGPDTPTNEEWYHRPVDLEVPMRFRILLKRRTSTIAGFEGATRIYLNSVDPWTLRDEIVERLLQLREQGLIAESLEIGNEYRLPDNPLGDFSSRVAEFRSH